MHEPEGLSHIIGLNYSFLTVQFVELAEYLSYKRSIDRSVDDEVAHMDSLWIYCFK